MIKILQIRRNTLGSYDGTDNFCRELYRMFLDDADCRVLPVHDIPQISSIFNYSYDDNTLEQEISKADIIHINGYTAWGTRKAIKMAKQMGKKVVYTAHWHPFEYLRRPLAGRLFFNLLLKPVIKRYVDVVTTINNEDTAFFSRFFPNVIRIPHSYSGQPGPSENKKKNMILFIGRINDQVKGFEHILSIPEGKYDIHCVGRGTIPVKRHDITQHIDISDDELENLYSKASLVAIPSRYEAFSYVALESMMHGTPVVMSDRVRIGDHLNDTDAYSIFRFGDIADFNEKIDHTIGQKFNITDIYNVFSPKNVKNMYKNVYLLPYSNLFA